jgi:hypothetical protein
MKKFNYLMNLHNLIQDKIDFERLVDKYNKISKEKVIS